MKKMTHRLSALFVAVWYLACIVGFDIHMCSSTGENYVSTFINGITCEDIHPEDLAESHACCSGCCGCSHHADGDSSHDSFSGKPCCSDDYQMLLLTGAGKDTGHRHHAKHHFCICALVPQTVQVPHHVDFPHSGSMSMSARPPMPDIDVQSVFSVWRI